LPTGAAKHVIEFSQLSKFKLRKRECSGERLGKEPSTQRKLSAEHKHELGPLWHQLAHTHIYANACDLQKKNNLDYTSKFNYWLSMHNIFIAHRKLHVKVLNVSASTQDWTDAGLPSTSSCKLN